MEITSLNVASYICIYMDIHTYTFTLYKTPLVQEVWPDKVEC